MLTVVILACGDSKRFREIYGGSYPPKQFLEFRAAADADPCQMWENVLHGLRTEAEVSLVLRTDHGGYRRTPRRRGPVQRCWIDGETRGQADTLRIALGGLAAKSDLLVVNCDAGFAPGLLDAVVAKGRTTDSIAALTFPAGKEEASRWSYIDDHPYFHQAAEKTALGTHALAGAYYFPRVDELEAALVRVCDERRYKEPYISQAFGYIPSAKLSVEIDRKDWYDWGTPEALERFIYSL